MACLLFILNLRKYIIHYLKFNYMYIFVFYFVLFISQQLRTGYLRVIL